MAIWSVEIQELERLTESFKGQCSDLEKELGRLVNVDDENIILLYSRRCLEVIVTDLCECELNRDRGTEPLKGIIDKLFKEKKVSPHIIASMHGLNELSTFGTHPKDFDPEQVKPVLNNLTIIIRWYLKYKKLGTEVVDRPTDKIRNKLIGTDDKRKSTNFSKKRLAGIISAIITVIVTIFVILISSGIIGNDKQSRKIEKSIAVLPFKLLSNEPDKQYLADGMMDAVLLHLSRIEDLRVMGRTSTEQYRVTDKTLTEIGRELGISYMLEGSFQKYGEDVRLIIQLIQTGKESHIWANQYDRKWNDVFSVQSEVAKAIASELHAIITPEEKQLIEKTPTTSLSAYDFFQRGRDEHWKYWLDNNNKEALEIAEDLYHEALKYDPKFAQAYTGLAWMYRDKYFWKNLFLENFLDSVMILCNIALSYDDQLSEAYSLKGTYYNETGKAEQAIKEFDKAVKLNPNDWRAYWERGFAYLNYDLVKSIENNLNAISLSQGRQFPEVLRSIGWPFFCAGFMEKAKYYAGEAFKLDKDSLKYYVELAVYEHNSGNYLKAIEYNKKTYSIDSNNYALGLNYVLLDQYEEALEYYKRDLKRKPETLNNKNYQAILFGMHRVGLAYWKNGFKKEGEYYFNELINYCEKLKKSGLWDPSRAAYDLAAVYAFKGDKEKAYENLKDVTENRVGQLWLVTYLKKDPLFDPIRKESEFQQIVRDYENKYQAEHERVKRWLEENKML